LKVDRTIKIRNEDRVRLKYGQCFWMYLEIYVILKQNDAITDVNDAIETKMTQFRSILTQLFLWTL